MDKFVLVPDDNQDAEPIQAAPSQANKGFLPLFKPEAFLRKHYDGVKPPQGLELYRWVHPGRLQRELEQEVSENLKNLLKHLPNGVRHTLWLTAWVNQANSLLVTWHLPAYPSLQTWNYQGRANELYWRGQRYADTVGLRVAWDTPEHPMPAAWKEATNWEIYLLQGHLNTILQMAELVFDVYVTDWPIRNSDTSMTICHVEDAYVAALDEELKKIVDRVSCDWTKLAEIAGADRLASFLAKHKGKPLSPMDEDELRSAVGKSKLRKGRVPDLQDRLLVVEALTAEILRFKGTPSYEFSYR